jgi:DNA-binding transcriptional LysR family regulator
MPTMQMDLLRTFATVADLGSFTKAGDLLGRTQPAISLQIKRLEDLIQAPLLERDSRGLRLTPAGETLATYARQILRLHDEALALLSKPVVAGSVRVGIPNDFAVSFLQEVLGDFLALEPGVSVEVHCEISARLLEALREGALDLAVAMSAEPAGPTAARLWAERLAWVGRADGTCERTPLPLVAYPEGCTYRARMTQALSKAGRPWRVACTSSSLAAVQAAVAAGLGLTVLSSHTIPKDLRVLGPESGLPGLADVIVGVYYDRGRHSEASMRLVNFITARLDEAYRRRTAAGLGPTT